jgi:hypothetical protein
MNTRRAAVQERNYCNYSSLPLPQDFGSAEVLPRRSSAGH